MRYLSQYSAVDDSQLCPCVEKQHIALKGKQSIALLNSFDSKMYFSYQKQGTAKNLYLFNCTLDFKHFRQPFPLVLHSFNRIMSVFFGFLSRRLAVELDF